MSDPMAPGGDYELRHAFSYVAEWQWRDVKSSKDPAALSFGPKPWVLPQGLIRPAPWEGDHNVQKGAFSYKPVAYLPVQRTNGNDKVPTLIIAIRLTAPQLTSNVSVPSWVGTDVSIAIVNHLKVKSPGVLDTHYVHGTLGKDLACRIEIPAKDVAGWLLPQSDLQAVVNENLLDFQFTLKGVTDQGNPVRGQSRNRVFLYCRKTVVFLPGLFASQIQIPTADGDIVGFPDFWDERELNASSPDTPPAMNLGFQRVDALECDDLGVPLIPCPKPTLLMLKGAVIDPFNSLHNARHALLPHVPDGFRLYALIVYPYDWRGDLTDCAAALLKDLGDLQKRLVQEGDNDDRVTVMGHSTGGVVIRRALAPIGAEECSEGLDPAIRNASRKPADTLINFAFFLSVPFQGAPKAASVLMTGLEAPEGDRQIPFIVPESLVAVSLSMPIVYHLHTSAQYPFRPSTSPSRPPGVARNNEADKAAFVRDVIAAGLMPQPWPVRAELAKNADHRQRLALASRAWHDLVFELHERIGGHSLQYGLAESWGAVRWFEGEIKKRNLQWQKDVRPNPLGWNGFLAMRAQAFHEKSAGAVTSAWKARTALFWGSCTKSPTLRQLTLFREGTTVFADTMDFLSKRQILVADIGSTRSENDVRQLANGGQKRFRQWGRQGEHEVVETRWRLEWVKQLSAGDATVPADSQLAEYEHVGSNLRTVPIDRESPEHMKSTKEDHVWQVLVRSIHANVIVQGPDSTTALKNAMPVSSSATAPRMYE